MPGEYSNVPVIPEWSERARMQSQSLESPGRGGFPARNTAWISRAPKPGVQAVG